MTRTHITTPAPDHAGAGGRIRPVRPPQSPPRGAPVAAAGWKPQPCGFSRREIRQVVIEQIG